MLPYRNTRIASIVTILFFGALFIYAAFAGRNILWGPSISLSGGSEFVQSDQPTIAIKGTAERITELHINGHPVLVTEAGSFDETVALSLGLNRVQLVAYDKAGRSTKRIVQIVYTPQRQESPTPSPDGN